MRILIPACKEKEVVQNVKLAVPKLNIARLKIVKDKKKYGKDFLQMEKFQVANNYKWGVLYMISMS